MGMCQTTKRFFQGLRALISLLVRIGEEMANVLDLDAALTGAEASAADVKAGVTALVAEYLAAKAAGAPDLAAEVARVQALKGTLDDVKAAIAAADAPAAE